MSPKETWLRLLLLDAGLPKPTSQLPLLRGRQLVAVFDLGWEEYKVAAEYDGDYHRSDRRRFVKDIDKLGIADDQGWIVIRVVSEHRPDVIVGRAYRALTRRGWRPDRHQRACALALSRAAVDLGLEGVGRLVVAVAHVFDDARVFQR